MELHGKIQFTNCIFAGSGTGCVSLLSFTCSKIKKKSIYNATIKSEFPEQDRKLRLLSAILEAVSPQSGT